MTHLLPAPVIAGYLPEPFPAAAERVVRESVDEHITIRIQHNYPFWTGQGNVPVMHIELRDRITGKDRGMIPNSPRSHWSLKDVREACDYFMALLAHEREQIARRQRLEEEARQQAQERARKRRAAFQEWFERHAQDAARCARKRRVIDANGMIWRVVDRVLDGVLLQMILESGEGGEARLVAFDCRLAYLTKQDEQRLRSWYRG